jgi:hypothetical protein
MLFTGIPLFRALSEDSALPASQKIFGSLSAVRTTCHPVWTLICPLFHPSGRRAIPSGRRQTKHHPSGRCVFPSGPYNVSRSFCSSLHSSGRLSSPSGRFLVIDQVPILSKCKYGKIAATVRTTWIPVRTRVSIKQVRNSNSNVRMSVCHGPDAQSTDMEIPCRRSTVRTAIPNGPDARSLIWKLLAANVQPSGRSS